MKFTERLFAHEDSNMYTAQCTTSQEGRVCFIGINDTYWIETGVFRQKVALTFCHRSAHALLYGLALPEVHELW